MKNNTMKNKTIINSLKNLGFSDLDYIKEESAHSLSYISPRHDAVIQVDLYDDPNSEGGLKITKNIKGGTNTIKLQSPLLTIPFIKSKVMEYTGLDLEKISSKVYTWEACMERLDRSYYLDKHGDLKPYPHQSINSDDLLQMYSHIPKEEQSKQLLAQTRLMVICDVLNREFPNSINTATYHPIIYTNGTRILWDNNKDNINPLVYLVSEEAVEAFYKHTENIKILEEYFAFTGRIINPLDNEQ